MNLIAIHGFKQSGKDTLADLLVDEFGYTKVAFADRLKEAIHHIFGVDRKLLFGDEHDKQQLSPVRWEDLHQIRKSDSDHPTLLSIRELLQIFATEICRDKIPSIWYRYLPIPPDAKIVISDCRFRNEADFLKERQATLIKVIRNNVHSTNHKSERGLPDGMMDHILSNDRDLNSFLTNGRQLFLQLGLKPQK